MSYKFNPFTGTLDEVGAGGGAATPGGADTQVQFNDGGALGGDAGLVYDKTTDKLTVGGDIDLDDGGTFSTTLQTVTPTANRTVSIPDATGTIGLVNGPTGSIQFNQAGALNGTSDFSTTLNWNNAATTFTGLKLNVTDTASAAGSNLLDLQSGGSSKFTVDVAGQATFTTAIFSGGGVEKATNFFFGAGNDVRLYRDAAATLAQRNGTNAQTFRLYNTYTDASNFERTSITRDSSGLVIDAQKGGTGVDPTNLLDLQVGGSSIFTVGSVGTSAASFALRIGANSAAWVPYGGAFAIGGTSGAPGLTVEGQLGTGFTSGALLWWTSSTAGGFYSQRDVALSRDQANVLKVSNGSNGTGYLKLIPTTVGALTAAATVGAGTKAFVTDSTSTLSSHHGQAVVGGGTNFVPVFSDGTNWIVG